MLRERSLQQLEPHSGVQEHGHGEVQTSDGREEGDHWSIGPMSYIETNCLKAMNILHFSSSTKLSDVSYEALQDKFSQRMKEVGLNIVLVLTNHSITARSRG